ncbi:MAG: ABC transporter permease [Nanobdellota archaeon]
MLEEISVMWHRQVKTYLRSKQRIFGSLAQPLLFLVALGFGLGSYFEQAGQGNYIQYLLPGIIGMTILFSGTMNGMSLIWDKQFGFLKETLVAPVKRVNLLIGRSLGGATTSVFQGILLLIIGIALGFKIQYVALLPIAIIALFCIALLFTLFGTSIATKMEDMQAFPMVINFIIMPMFFLSGALFPITNFPTILQIVAKINPMTYCVDLLQYSLNGSSTFPLTVNIIVISSLIVVVSIIGTTLFKKIET